MCHDLQLVARNAPSVNRRNLEMEGSRCNAASAVGTLKALRRRSRESRGFGSCCAAKVARMQRSNRSRSAPSSSHIRVVIRAPCARESECRVLQFNTILQLSRGITLEMELGSADSTAHFGKEFG
jgi:hypothetical protein